MFIQFAFVRFSHLSRATLITIIVLFLNRFPQRYSSRFQHLTSFTKSSVFFNYKNVVLRPDARAIVLKTSILLYKK